MPRTPLLLVCLALAAAPVVAASNVAFDPDVDFSRYRTWAWTKGTPAGRPQVQRWIEMAIERELEAKGLHEAPAEEADLLVSSVAYAQMEALMQGGYLHLDVWGVGLIRADVVNKTTGNLLIDLIDPDSGKPVWRGVVQKAVKNDNLGKLQKKIDKLIGKLFEDFPPSG